MPRFNIGDVVKLKSGGPEMTIRYNVDSYQTPGTSLAYGAHCQWYDESSSYFRTDIFHPNQLEKVEKEENETPNNSDE